MNICVFLGPTLAADEAGGVLDAVYLPPAAQGDVLMATDDGADVIGIVDGYFQGAPSVWHKEILWAMSRGVHVYGSSSMGALRAAELSAFGMQGIGRIFEDYRDGVISDDDEVAVVHGPEEMGYRPTTVPMVNMRATLAKAMEQQVIPVDAHDAIVDAARALSYWDRTYDALLEKSAGSLGPGLLRELAAWIEDHAVDQKRDDAIAMLRSIREIEARPFNAGFHFQRTSAWENLVDEVHIRGEARDPEPSTAHEALVLDELRLEPDLYGRIVTMAGEPGGSRDPVMASLVESGHYEYFSERATDKERVLSTHFGAPPEYADAMLTPFEVLTWYFEDCQGAIVPMDLEGYATELGLRDVNALCRLFLHELLYEMSRERDDTMDRLDGVMT